MSTEQEAVNAPKPKQFTKTPRNDELSEYLHGGVYLCGKDGGFVEGDDIEFYTLEADMTLDSQYSSPFENSNPEQRLPTLLATMQSGDWVGTVGAIIKGVNAKAGTNFSTDGLDVLNSFEGKSNFTKVNSTQIFVAAQPVKLNVTAYFQAWSDALVDVENKLKILSSFALPQQLAEKSIIGNLADGNGLDSLFPSTAPPFVGVRIANKTYAPMVLESLSQPLITQLDSNGNRISVEVQMTFSSRQAWDANNIKNLFEKTF